MLVTALTLTVTVLVTVAELIDKVEDMQLQTEDTTEDGKRATGDIGSVLVDVVVVEPRIDVAVDEVRLDVFVMNVVDEFEGAQLPINTTLVVLQLPGTVVVDVIYAVRGIVLSR